MDQVRTPLGQTLALLDGTGRRRNRPVDYPKKLYVGQDANRHANCAPNVNNASR